MGKVILFLSFMSLGILVVLSNYAPQSSAIWLASTEHSYNLLRAGVMIVLATLLVTNPPRHTQLRVFAGILATVLAAWSLRATYQNQMQLLDGASLLTASIAMAIAAREPKSQGITRRHPKGHFPSPSHT